MRKIFIAALSTGVVLASVTACSPINKIASTVTHQSSKNVLTNRDGTNGKILFVKVDDTPPAHPQIGINDADVVYIEQVEGGLTRLAAIFTDPSRLPPLIGPVRSARISDIDIAAGFGRIAFAYSGEQTKMRPVIAAANVVNLSAEREPASIYSRDLTRVEPTNLILHAPELLAKASQEGASLDDVKSIGFTFGDAPTNGRALDKVKFSWPASRYSAQWSTTEKRWLLEYNGSPDLDANNVHLGPTTLILQKVSITDSIYHDKVGGITPLSAVTGSGTAYMLRDGKVFPIFWNRATPTDKTSWTLKDGTSAHFASGQVWIALIDKEPLFTYPVTVQEQKSSSPAPSKSK